LDQRRAERGLDLQNIKTHVIYIIWPYYIIKKLLSRSSLDFDLNINEHSNMGPSVPHEDFPLLIYEFPPPCSEAEECELPSSSMETCADQQHRSFLSSWTLGEA
jgi:hypothetical protein